jgi:hypothetical protein
MGPEQQLDEFKEQFLRTAPAGRAALYEAKIDKFRSNFALEAAAGIGTRAPEFRLPDVKGDLVSLTNLLREGPVERRPCRETAIRSFRFAEASYFRGVNHDQVLFPSDAEPRENRAFPRRSRPAL